MTVVYKCKQCGGDVEVIEGGLTGKCIYCGTEQTLPSEDDEKVKQLLVRANDFRMSADFDRAIYTYEKVLELKESEPEAHWGLLLSKYGVEYVRDNYSYQYKPTLHRISAKSIMEDPEYIATMRYANPAVANKYKQAAEEIEAVLKELLVLAANQEAYDVFISYKEADDHTRRRTDDSYLAHDLYNELTQKGYRVFFAPKSLGTGLYEPKIYAAILSAKVMIVLGTKTEYFEAVWVKNEWSRYIELIESGENKTLIPVYKYMEATDLPNKLAKYQAYDMDSMSFLQTLTSLIDQSVTKKQTEPVGSASKEAIYMERAKLALENGKFESARSFYNHALNENPKNAEAYCGLLMSELKVKKLEDIVNAKKLLTSYESYKNAFRFADSQLKATLVSCEEKVSERIKNEKFENLKSSLRSITATNQICDLKESIEQLKHANSKELVAKIDDIVSKINPVEAEIAILKQDIRSIESEKEQVIEEKGKVLCFAVSIIVTILWWGLFIIEGSYGYGFWDWLGVIFVYAIFLIIALIIDTVILRNLKKIKYIKKERELTERWAYKRSVLEADENTLKTHIKEINKLAD